MSEYRTKIPFHRDPVIRGIIAQAILIVLVFWGIYEIYINTVENLTDRGIKITSSFMTEVAPFIYPLGFSPFWDIELGVTKYWEIFIVGIHNTLLVSLLAIPAATFLGLVVGIAKLSGNFLLTKLAGIYVEIFRNTPLLLQLMFWAFAIFPIGFNLLPPPKESYFIGNIVLNSAGIYFPHYTFNAIGWVIVLVALVVGVVACRFMANWSSNRQNETGQTFPTVLVGLLILIVFLIIGLIAASGNGSVDYPVLKGFNYRGGARPPIQLIVLWFGLTVYTAAFIAETVRGGTLSVSKGQSEASLALGLDKIQRLKLVILPQALRVIIPPTISQYLNLIKNSSLAIAVGYPDLYSVWTGIALNQTGQSLIIVGMTIAVYECLSLLTSGLANAYNKRVQITER